VDARFQLPGTPEQLEVKGEFAWSDGKGNAGIRFVYLPIDSKKCLGKWLSSQAPERRLPGAKASGPSFAI
jgi:hypothetical protein